MCVFMCPAVCVSVIDVHPVFQLILESIERKRAGHLEYPFEHLVLYTVVIDCLEKRTVFGTSVEENVVMGREREVWGSADSIQSG